jgi:glutamate synthase domain-containing protein 2
MSPWRMMNEWGVPLINLHALLHEYADRLAARGEYVPPIAVGGGFAFEDMIFKGLSLGAPSVKMVGMARAAIAAAMVGKTIGRAIEQGQLPVYVERFGNSKEEIFISANELREKIGRAEYDNVPTGALGLYTYYERLAQGLRQLMAGSRKFALQYITRDDIVALTREAADVSGIQYVMDADKAEVDKLLGA